MRIESKNQPDGWREPEEITPESFGLPRKRDLPLKVRWLSPEILVDLYNFIRTKGEPYVEDGQILTYQVLGLEGSQPGKTIELIIGTEHWPDQRSMLIIGYINGERTSSHIHIDLENKQQDLIAWDPSVTEADIRKILGKS